MPGSNVGLISRVWDTAVLEGSFECEVVELRVVGVGHLSAVLFLLLRRLVRS